MSILHAEGCERPVLRDISAAETDPVEITHSRIAIHHVERGILLR
jgi:hypothetical protein